MSALQKIKGFISFLMLFAILTLTMIIAGLILSILIGFVSTLIATIGLLFLLITIPAALLIGFYGAIYAVEEEDDE